VKVGVRRLWWWWWWCAKCVFWRGGAGGREAGTVCTDLVLEEYLVTRGLAGECEYGGRGGGNNRQVVTWC
jgi:hypothetical protein